MKTFLRVFAVILVAFVVVGLFLDNHFEVSREVEIDAPPSTIHFYVADLNQWPQWSPWKEQDPSIKVTVGRISKGVGASQAWSGESGGGALTITQSSESEGIVYDLTFDGDSTVYTSGMRYTSNGKTTKVTWYMRGEMQPIIIGNYFAQLMDTLVGQSFSDGLAKLKLVVEKT